MTQGYNCPFGKGFGDDFSLNVSPAQATPPSTSSPPPLQGGLSSFLPEGEVPRRGGGVSLTLLN